MIVANGTFTDQHSKNRTFKVACETVGNDKVSGVFLLGRWVCIIDDILENRIHITRNQDAEYTFSENFPSICDTGKNKIQEVIEIEIEKIR